MGCNQSTSAGSVGRESKANVDEQTYMPLGKLATVAVLHGIGL